MQPAVNGRRQVDESPSSSVDAETTKLLANSSYGNKIIVHRRHSVTRYMNDEKTHAASYNNLFKRLGRINDQLYEVELAESGIEHKEPIVVGFFILQHDKLEMLELYYNFFEKFCDTDKYEQMEMETDSLYLALAGKKCINVYEVRKSKSGSKNCKDSFTADAFSTLFSPTCCAKHTKKYDKGEPGLFKKIFDALKCCACVASQAAIICK